MAKKYACVLDFGSGKLTTVIGERGVNNTFNILGTGEAEYAGFYKAEFIEPDKLFNAIETSITYAQNNSGVDIKSLYIGVPAEFTYCLTKSASINFKKRTRLGNDEILALFDIASRDIQDENCTIINRSPICFMLDDNKKCMDPKGQVSTKLYGEIGFILADNGFIDLITKCVSALHIENVEFISSALAESLYLVEPEVRDTGALLIDCGFITTSVSYVKGDAIIGLNSFSLGGGHITGDLNQCLKISYKDAEYLKRKVVLSLDATDDDFYEITSDNGVVKPVSAKLTNEIVAARLEMIAKLITKCFAMLKGDTKAYVPVMLTGGGISYLKGGKDFLSKYLGTNIEIIYPNVPQLNRPHFSSVLGLLDVALTQEQSKKLTFAQKLKRLFKK